MFCLRICLFQLSFLKYQYCGPGTKLKKRLQKGDQGRNGLDKACKLHDIAYAENVSSEKRREADKLLADDAWKRFKANDSSIGEKLSSLAVTGIMKAKTKLGLGIQTSKSKPKPRKPKTKKVFQNAVGMAKKSLKGQTTSYTSLKTMKDAAKIALNAATVAVRKEKKPKKQMLLDVPRVIPVPKTGGVLPLIPIFAGLSALGAIMGGSASIANAVITTKNAKESLNEANRHNKMMEAIAIGKNKNGHGVYLKPYKKGLGVYLKPYDSFKKNQ